MAEHRIVRYEIDETSRAFLAARVLSIELASGEESLILGANEPAGELTLDPDEGLELAVVLELPQGRVEARVRGAPIGAGATSVIGATTGNGGELLVLLDGVPLVGV